MQLTRNLKRGRERKLCLEVSDGGHSSTRGCTALRGLGSLGRMNIETSCHTPFSSNANFQVKHRTHSALFIANSARVGDGEVGGHAMHQMILFHKLEFMDTC